MGRFVSRAWAWSSFLLLFSAVPVHADHSDHFDHFEMMGPPPPPLAVLSSSEIFNKYKSLIFKLTTVLKDDGIGPSYGTAFVVDESGLLATSFHVVADALLFPGKYSLKLQIPGEGTAKRSELVEVVAIDAPNDLALIKIDPKALGLTAAGPKSMWSTKEIKSPATGERIYPIGFPSNLNLSIVDGVYNEKISLNSGDVLVSSSPINHGMSGGPMVESHGVLIGVNRAIQGEAQNIAFFSDARAIGILLKTVTEPGAKRTIASAVVWKEQIEKQLKIQETTFFDLLARPGAIPISFAGVKFGNFPFYSRCGKNQDNELFQGKLIQSCNAPSFSSPDGRHEGLGANGIFIETSKDTAQEGGHSKSGTDDLLSSAKFSSLVNKLFSRTLSDHSSFTEADCSERVVVNKNQLRIHLNYCVSGFRSFKNLYSAVIQMEVPKANREPAAVGIISFTGLSSEGITQAFDYYLDQIELTGAKP